MHFRMLHGGDRAGRQRFRSRCTLTETDAVINRLGWILFCVARRRSRDRGRCSGYFVARAALAPVRRLTRATEEITTTRDLSRRVEEGGRDELGRLGTSFNTMLAALEESQQAQRQLVADASHELRTPLTSLRTNVELLARGTLPEEERSKALADVSAQLEEMTELVTDVVDLARDGEREQAVGDVRLDLVVADAVERARLHSPALVFATRLDESLVRGVGERIFRAVANVLDNAAKWSPAGGDGRRPRRGRRADRPRPRAGDRGGGPAARLRPLLPLAGRAGHARLGTRSRDRAPGGRVVRRVGDGRSRAGREGDARLPQVPAGASARDFLGTSHAALRDAWSNSAHEETKQDAQR